uniref:(northern house mosquito) hypothetical protein n=1 Tax=Culex pipiens TaxID=7175 RepID=A0A8D8IQ51_CULPI
MNNSRPSSTTYTCEPGCLRIDVNRAAPSLPKLIAFSSLPASTDCLLSPCLINNGKLVGRSTASSPTPSSSSSNDTIFFRRHTSSSESCAVPGLMMVLFRPIPSRRTSCGRNLFFLCTPLESSDRETILRPCYNHPHPPTLDCLVNAIDIG